MEAGPVFDGDGNWDTPLALKWGAGERTELFVSNSPYVRTGGLVGYPFSPRLSGFLELTGVFHPGIQDEALLTTLGLGYAVAPSLVLDAAVVWSESGGESSTVWTAGVTANVGGFKQR